MLAFTVSSAAFNAPAISGISARSIITMQEVTVSDSVVPEEPKPFDPEAYAKTLAGVSGPLGYFDPAGFLKDESAGNEKMTEGKVLFYREVEVKHARVAMLAALGYPIAEQFHPLFATDDAPSLVAFQQSPLQTFWPAVVLAIAVFEVFSVFTFQNPASVLPDGSPAQPWTIRTDHAPGDLGFDPLGLKPANAADLKLMQTKELNNGRLAMIAIAGMIAQEYVTGGKLF